jgi:hypothetical protein
MMLLTYVYQLILRLLTSYSPTEISLSSLLARQLQAPLGRKGLREVQVRLDFPGRKVLPDSQDLKGVQGHQALLDPGVQLDPEVLKAVLDRLDLRVLPVI